MIQKFGITCYCLGREGLELDYQTIPFSLDERDLLGIRKIERRSMHAVRSGIIDRRATDLEMDEVERESRCCQWVILTDDKEGQHSIR